MDWALLAMAAADMAGFSLKKKCLWDGINGIHLVETKPCSNRSKPGYLSETRRKYLLVGSAAASMPQTVSDKQPNLLLKQVLLGTAMSCPIDDQSL